MKHKHFTQLFLIISIFTAAGLTFTVFSAENTIISINPSQTYSSVFQSFTVNMTISNVINLSAWELKLTFNPYIINCIGAFIPDDNIFAGHPTTGLGLTIDNVNGLIRAFNGLWELGVGVNGSGKLCSFAFQALSPGISALSVCDLGQNSGTNLWDPENNHITFESRDGIVQINSEGFNLYVFTITQNGVPYNVTIFTNSSITNFNFNSTLQKIYFNASGTQGTLGSCSVSIPKPLLNGTFAVLVDDRSTYYKLSTDALNQYLYFNYQHTPAPVYIQMITTLVGDINGDRKVDMRDVAIVARAFGTSPGNPKWDPRADLNNDLKVNMMDIGIVAKNFGKRWNP